MFFRTVSTIALTPARSAPGNCPRSASRMTGLSLAGLSVVLTGCASATNTHQQPAPSVAPTGEIAKPASTILADARNQLLAATSVRVRGTVTSTSTSTSTSTPTSTSTSTSTSTPTSTPRPSAKAFVQQRLDLRVGRGPEGQALATGTITTIASAGGQTLTVPIAVIRVGDQLFIYADKSYYARIGSKVALAAGHWLSLPVSQDRAFADLTDVTRFAAGLAFAGARTGGELRLGTVPAIVVQSRAALVYVASTGAPRLLRLQRPAAENALAGTLDFTENGARLSVRVPAGAIALQSLLR
jgi:hypothetical protein